MTMISSAADPQALTMAFVAEFTARPARVWQVWEDPRQLERWWGPPTWPATFTRHDVAVGGRSNYAMTGPDGERSGGYWEFLAVDEEKSFEVEDGFAIAPGVPNPDMPSRIS